MVLNRENKQERMEQLLSTNFTVFDWVIVTGYITGITYLGNYLNRYIQSSSSTFMIGAGKSPLALNTASYIGTELGLVTIMYAAIEGYTRGFSYLAIPLVALIAAFIIGRTNEIFPRLVGRLVFHSNSQPVQALSSDERNLDSQP